MQKTRVTNVTNVTLVGNMPAESEKHAEGCWELWAQKCVFYT